MSLYTGNNSGLMSSLFGSYKNSLFGSLSSSLSDYSMIRSGAYGKLMKAYYAKEADTTQKTDKTDKTDKTKKNDKTAQMSTQEKEQLQQIQELKTGAKSLSDAASALQKNSLYEAKTAEDGTSAVDRSKITSALKSFVGAYNTYIEQTGKSSKSTVQKQNLSALKATAANSKLLAEVGISYDKKGNLTLDETKAQKASLSTIKSLFQGGGSYGDTIGDKATATYRLANSASYKTSGGTRYSSQGTYSTLGNTSNLLDQLL